MVFTKRGVLALLVVLTVLQGCSLVPTKDKPETALEEPDVSAEAGDAATTEAPFVPLPNPYLIDPPSIPKQAKEEFAQAIKAMNDNQWKQAASLLTLMTETYPGLSGPFVNLGICLHKQELWDDAEAALKKAIVVNKTNMDAYTALGVLYRERGRFNDAEQVYLAALEVWPHHADSHRNLGILYELYMGRFNDALAHYRMLQTLLKEEDRQLKGWIIDLERRLPETEEASSE